MPISPVNFLWLTDPHDLQGMPIPNGNLCLEWLKRSHQPQRGLALFVGDSVCARLEHTPLGVHVALRAHPSLVAVAVSFQVLHSSAVDQNGTGGSQLFLPCMEKTDSYATGLGKGHTTAVQRSVDPTERRGSTRPKDGANPRQVDSPPSRVAYFRSSRGCAGRFVTRYSER